jgi:MFS family permease
MLGASFASQVWHLFISQGVCFGFGLGFLHITAAPILGQWFLKKRSLAVGIASSGAGFGGLAYNLVAGAGIELLGVQWTYRLLALCTLIINLVCSILLRDRNSIVKPQQRAFNLREFSDISVVLLIAWGTFTELGYIVLLYSLPNYAQSIGLTAHQGSVVGAVLNLGLALGRPVVGFLSDTFGRIDVATAMTGLCGIFCLAIWVPAQSYAVLLLFALLSGTVTGTFWGTVVPVTAEVVGLQRLPAAFGMICLPLVFPTVFAEPIALQLATSSGYITSKIFVGCMFLLGASSTWALRSWKICDTEKQGMTGAEVQTTGRSWLTPRRLFMNKRV